MFRFYVHNYPVPEFFENKKNEVPLYVVWNHLNKWKKTGILYW